MARTHARLATSCALLLGASASAQEPTPPAPSREPVEEIIITGERRDLTAQELGLSVSAFSEETLDAQNIQEIQDLQFRIPSFVATSVLSQITLRGIGTDLYGPAADVGVGVHVDGVFQPAAAGLLGYFDVQQIEVFPGPQGTRGGRHTNGGSVYLWTNRPTPRWELSGDLEVASYGKIRVRGVANVPLGETLAARVALVHERPPYPLTARPVGQSLSANLDGGTMLRASLRWTPSETLSVDLIGTRVRQPGHGGSWHYLGDYPAYPAGQSPLFYESTPSFTGATPPRSALEVRQDRASEEFAWPRAWTLQLNAEWELGPLVVRSYSHYGDAHYHANYDADSSDLDIEHAIYHNRIESFTQELSLASSGDGRVQWLIGGNFQSERPNRWRFRLWDRQVNAAAASYLILNNLDFSVVSQCGPTGADPCFFTAFPDAFHWLLVDATTQNDVAGAFASLSVDVSERVRLAGGVRYNRTERSLHDASLANIFRESLDAIDDGFCLGAIGVALPAAQCFDVLIGAPSGGFLTPTNVAFLAPLRGDRNIFTGNTEPVRLQESWDSVTGALRVELKPGDETLLYASFSTASQPGGFNLVEGWAGHKGFGPETVFAYELGAKGTLRDQLQLSGALYWYDYQHKHTSGIVRGFPLTSNASQAYVYGAELQLQWAASDALRLRGSLGWSNAEYASDFLSHDDAVGPDNPTSYDPAQEPGRNHGQFRPAENLDGNALSRAPDWTLALGGDYRLDFGPRGAVVVRLDFAWRDAIDFRQFGNALDRQEAFTRTDLALRWEQPGDGTGWAELYVNNVEDRRNVKTSLFNVDDHRNWFLAEPRMVGLRVGWSWSSEEAPFARLRSTD
jgi:iron complex outermembrane receptor protein